MLQNVKIFIGFTSKWWSHEISDSLIRILKKDTGLLFLMLPPFVVAQVNDCDTQGKVTRKKQNKENGHTQKKNKFCLYGYDTTRFIKTP